MDKNALLLINLGTPKSPNRNDVKQYLAEFLTDKRVIDLPLFVRYILVYAFILPFRPKKTAEAYQSIWTEQGSPLLFHSQKLLYKLQQSSGDHIQVALGMRYGSPSIEQAIESIQNCKQITILPLYPQYSSATTGSSIEKCLDILKKQTRIPSLTIIREFYQHPEFISAQAEIIRKYITNCDHLLFSYHGIPERQLKKSGCTSPCEKVCTTNAIEDQDCYKFQCHKTSEKIAEQLSLKKKDYSVSFQSRLGKTSWIKPYTDEVLPKLAHQGIKRLAVSCPSFVSDCLETLEEIGIRAKEQWLQLGGEDFQLIPCLNDSDHWVEALLKITTP